MESYVQESISFPEVASAPQNFLIDNGKELSVVGKNKIIRLLHESGCQ